MARKWIFQANPKLYDIEAALGELEEIWWRVPQYTADIHRGDVVLLWQSGEDSGVVGVGRVIGEPQQHESDDVERPFILDPEVAGTETRALVRVRATAPIAKDQVRQLPGLDSHPIIKAPYGTVFPLDDDQFRVLEPLVAPPPEDLGRGAAEFPAPFAWDQRSKSTHPMPGGYDGYLDSLRELLLKVQDDRPTRSELPQLIAEMFGVTKARSDLLSSFVRKAGFLIDRGQAIDLSEWSTSWISSADPRIVVGLLHSRIRFVGEMLITAEEPRTTGELLEIANQQYGCDWSTKAQIDRRRGWLQSAGMLELDETNRLVITSAGHAMVKELVLQSPVPGEGIRREPKGMPIGSIAEPELTSPERTGLVLPQLASDSVVDLVKELHSAAVDSSDPDRFERAVRDAFAWLGFQAEWLGGSGKTDVLLDAPLGKSRSYRVIIDCKTSASGAVGDSQVDWITLSEHRKKHDANFVALVAPTPSGQRLFARASEQKVAVISVDELTTLCEQHLSAPLDLEAYRSLFDPGGAASTADIAEQAEEWLHLVGFAEQMIDSIAGRQELFGGLTARDIHLLLLDQSNGRMIPEEDVQLILGTLAGPLLQILTGSPETGYRMTTSKDVARYRLEVLAGLLLGERGGSSDNS